MGGQIRKQRASGLHFFWHGSSAAEGNWMQLIRIPYKWAVFLVTVVPVLYIPERAFAIDFFPSVNLSQTTTFSWMGRVKVVENLVYVAWSEKGPNENRIVFRKSSDRGETFGPVRFLSDLGSSNQAGNLESYHLTVRDSHLYAIWSAKPDKAGSNIFFAAYDSDGQTSTPPRQLSQNDRAATRPLIAMGEKEMYVAWLSVSQESSDQHVISLTRSSVNEVNFHVPQELFIHPAPSSVSLLMAAQREVLYLCWTARTKVGEILRCTQSIDQGLTFEEPVDVTAVSGPIRFHKLIVQGSHIVIAWLESGLRAGLGRLLVAMSFDRGGSFNKPLQLSENVLSMGSVASNDREAVFTAWIEEHKGILNVVFAKSEDGGETFSEPVNISQSHGGLVQFAHLYSNSEQLIVIWKAETRDSPRKSDIFYSASTDEGVTFSPPQNLSQTAGNSTLPMMDVAGSRIYAVWVDNTPGNFEVFFSRSLP